MADVHGARQPSPLGQLTLLRVREMFREPGAVFWVFGFPLLLAIGLGLAFRSRAPDPVKVAVVDSAGWVAAALPPPTFIVSRHDIDAARMALRRGQVDLMVESSAAGQARLRGDDTRPESRLARVLVADALERARGRSDVLQRTDDLVVEPGSRYIDFLLPGLIGMNLMGSSMWGVGWAVVDARKKKLLKRLAATPMRRRDYLLSLLLSRLMFLVLEVGALVIIGRAVFGVHTQGSQLAVFALALVGGFAFTGLALLIASRPRSTEVASGWLNAVQLPMWLLSGSFFAATRFPDWLQPVVQALPLTALNDALRAVINEGQSFSSQLPEVGVLAFWGVVPLVIGIRTFRWQ